MKNLSIVAMVLCGVFLSGYVSNVLVVSADGRGDDDDDGRSAFSRRVAGTYLGEVETQNAGALLNTFTLNADGTYTATNTNNPFTVSPEHGAWKRVGRRRIAFTSLIYSFDADAALEFIFRIRGEASFSRDFDRVEASFMTDVFLPDQDPLHDEPVGMDIGVVQARRLHVME